MNNHFYYGENRFHARFPWDVRKIEKECDRMYQVSLETRTSMRKKMASDFGFTGYSILHEYLYPLYGFNVLSSLVIDIYHTLPLNIVKNQLVRIMDLEIIDLKEVDSILKEFPWTRELKDGRLPKDMTKGIGHWKAEGLQKFAFPFLECTLEEKIQDTNLFEILSIISRLTEMHFFVGRNGWTNRMIDVHEDLSRRLAINIEEHQGLSMCTISVHNLTHVHEDLENFSASDNYWCALHEHAVKHYVRKSHNCKGIEASFAKSESRREFLKGAEDRINPKHINPGKCNIPLVRLIFIFQWADSTKSLYVRKSSYSPYFVMEGGLPNVTKFHQIVTLFG